MNPTVKWIVAALLAAVAGGYFALMVWRAGAMARVLLPRGYAERGWSEPQLTVGVRFLGGAGLALSVACLVTAVARIVG